MTDDAIVNQTQVLADGTILVRLAKRIFPPGVGGAVISSSWHRTSFVPGCDHEAIMDAVDADLTARGFGAVDWDDVRDLITTHHTVGVVADYEAAIAAADAALLARVQP
jgi:hypothetical protein